MEAGEKLDAWKIGLKIQGEYFQHTGEKLDLNTLENAIAGGLRTSVNREIIKLSILAANSTRNPLKHLKTDNTFAHATSYSEKLLNPQL